MSAHVIVIGNEKGGSGKTTTAMHLAVSLLCLGFKVSTLDLDIRQKSLTRYVENRSKTAEKLGLNLLLPQHNNIEISDLDSKSQSLAEDSAKISDLFATLQDSADFIIVDTPGSDTPINRVVHSYANTVISPINDSFLDLDLIGKIDSSTLNSSASGIYSAMLWEQKMERIKRNAQEMSWVVVRNRLSALDAKNKRKMHEAIKKLSKKLGFKVAHGFGDRVIFKELFLDGLTLHDADKVSKIKITPSVLAARLELTRFVKSLDISEVMQKFEKL